MNPRELIRATEASFRFAGIPDPEYDSSVLLSHLTGRSPLSLRLDEDTVLDADTLARFDSLRERRLQREPLQYILEEAPFCGRLFYVDPRVLIPRPETELLFEWALEILAGKTCPKILDLCCGSGCLGISLKLSIPSATVLASDLSGDALDVARLNASRLNADIGFVQGDLFAAVTDHDFDLIVSNPPYISTDECRALQPEITHEPHCALDGGTDGLAFYRRICRDAPCHLVPGGSLLMELGDGESAQVSSLVKEAGFTAVEIRNDYQSLPRMICGRIL